MKRAWPDHVNLWDFYKAIEAGRQFEWKDKDIVHRLLFHPVAEDFNNRKKMPDDLPITNLCRKVELHSVSEEAFRWTLEYQYTGRWKQLNKIFTFRVFVWYDDVLESRWKGSDLWERSPCLVVRQPPPRQNPFPRPNPAVRTPAAVPAPPQALRPIQTQVAQPAKVTPIAAPVPRRRHSFLVVTIANQDYARDPLGHVVRDAERFFSLWPGSTHLRFKNFTAEEIRQCFPKIRASLTNANYDGLVFYYAGHGAQGDQLLGLDYKTVAVRELFDAFGGESMNSYAAKPKLLYLQCCRGYGEETSVIDHHSEAAQAPQTRPGQHLRQLPVHANFFIHYASWQDHVSKRGEDGGWFTKELLDVYRTHEKRDLWSLSLEVNRRVADNHKGEQQPSFESSMHTTLEICKP